MSNTQKFQLTQQGKIYILTTSIDGEFVKLTCHQPSVPNSPKYLGRFSLAQLRQMSKKFNTMTTIYQAQEFLSQSIENQKVSVQNQGNIINIVLYFQQNTQTEKIISTDYKTQEINYNTQPVEYNYNYNTVEQQQVMEIPLATNLNLETVENNTNTNYLNQNINYEIPQENNNYIISNENQTYENYDTGITNYQNYQTYENINYDNNNNNITTTNTNYDYNLNGAVEVQQTQNNTYETSIKTNEMETLTLPLRLSQREKKVDENKYLLEIEALKNQIKILKEEITILKTKTVEKTVVKTVDNSKEILILQQEIERLKKIEIYFENYKRQKEEEISKLKLRIEELLKDNKNLELMIAEIKLKMSEYMKESKEKQKQTLTIQDTRLEIIKGDILQSPAELELLTRKMCKDYGKITLNLLYKATVDSDKASVFHNKCDSASNSLVLVQATNGKRFGGYTSCSWEGNSIEKKDEDAFVFSLDKMEVYDIIPGEDAIGCYPKYGPVFLGCQIRIYDEFFKNGGTTFEKGANYDTEEDFELTGGLKNFQIKEIEVYSVELE